ncbi:hypothetical protein BDF14DRAFT_1866753 [Spinellus fusiger]|nr:hypothetical protein BDF14DRAFT_1866753 [Spinellus fusiger]
MSLVSLFCFYSLLLSVSLKREGGGCRIIYPRQYSALSFGCGGGLCIYYCTDP